MNTAISFKKDLLYIYIYILIYIYIYTHTHIYIYIYIYIYSYALSRSALRLAHHILSMSNTSRSGPVLGTFCVLDGVHHVLHSAVHACVFVSPYISQSPVKGLGILALGLEHGAAKIYLQARALIFVRVRRT